ncbi:MAG: hypothetical protein AAGA80_19265 [Cyanobacteria bacterium P01_F01_bin.143]
MTQPILEAQAASSTFNANISEFDPIAFEHQRQTIFNQTHNPYYEITTYFNYNEGIKYHEITANNYLIGNYYRNPWLNTWLATSTENGYEVEFATHTAALNYLKRQYLAAKY